MTTPIPLAVDLSELAGLLLAIESGLQEALTHQLADRANTFETLRAKFLKNSNPFTLSRDEFLPLFTAVHILHSTTPHAGLAGVLDRVNKSLESAWNAHGDNDLPPE